MQRLLVVVASLVMSSACTPAPAPPGPVKAAGRSALTIDSQSGCTLDQDCVAGRYCFQGQCAAEYDASGGCGTGESCTSRGRCALPASVAANEPLNSETGEPTVSAAPELTSGVVVSESPQSVLFVAPDQETAELVLTLSADAPAAGVPYRVDRDDDPASSAKVLRARGARQLRIAIPSGRANPSSPAPRVVKADVVTSVGRFSVALVPARPVEGSYAGSARITAFGPVGLPIEFSILTEPAGASLQQATRAYLALPVADEQLFSPIRSADGSVKHVTRELTFDPFTERWVAVFDHAFAFASGALFGDGAATQVRRTLRFELEPTGRGELIGAFKDVWTGLYETRSTQGVVSQEPVLFEGTLELSRVDRAPARETLLPPVEHPAANPQPLPAPPLGACSAAGRFTVPDVVLGGTTYGCQGIDSVASFEAATADARARCAVAVGRAGLAGPTTAATIVAYLDDTIPDPGNSSFAEFIERCAKKTEGTCVPNAQVLCGRQLLASAYRAQATDTPLARQVVTTYQLVSRETFLGRQLAAFHNDATSRADWLKATDYPAIVTSAVKDLSGQLLQRWQEGVLDVHFEVLAGQLDPSGLSVLSRKASVADALDARQQLLIEMMQSWRGSVEALTLGAARWNALFQDAPTRRDRSAWVARRTFDLYLTAGVLKNLNLDADAGFLSASLAGGFAELVRESSQLGLPFNKLVYARDGEVVVNTSLDPTASNETLLSARRTEALAQLELAEQSVLGILSQLQAEALNETQLRDRMNNEINDLRTELIELCGVPVGCTLEQARTDDACRPLVSAGRCGFAVDKADGGVLAFAALNQNVSTAGLLLLDEVRAAQGARIAEAELEAQVKRTQLMEAETDAFAADLKRWADKNSMALTALQSNVARRQALRNESTRALLASLSQKATKRAADIAAFREEVNTWNRIRLDGVAYETGLLTSSAIARDTASGLINAAEAAHGFFDAATTGLPTSLTDFTSPGRMALKMAATGVTISMRIAAQALDFTAMGLEVARERHQLIQSAQWENLKDLKALEAAVSEDELARIDAALAEKERLNADEVAVLTETAELARRTLEAELTLERDLAELRRRRTELQKELTQIAALELRYLQALQGVTQKEAEYLGEVQRAQLISAKLDELERQRANVNRLVGSPAAIFSRANKLTQAEQRLGRAKKKLMDWLVALEFLAVRPFMDQRLQILLANNTFQLEKIAEEMKRLESVCGGPINGTVAVLSLRDELLDLALPSADPVTGATLEPDARLREVLRRGAVPVDKRIRYSADSTLGGLLSRKRDVLSATFGLNFRDFANLEVTCNAKLKSIDVQLVGALGSGRPTVSVLYDGTSQLRSCQPGIDDYVALFGPQTTTYGSTTLLRTAGRSVSPVAGVNEFTAVPNQSLGGLPLVSQYTLLIDTSVGENGKLDWSKLEDVLIKLEYTYQDVFPQGQCQ